MRVYLLRHGETDWNIIRRLQGAVDIPLNALGMQQAASWRSYFSAIQLAAIYSSSLGRALHTAVLATGRPACVIPGFNERGFGVWEGRTWAELEDTVTELDERWNDNLFYPAGGESRIDLYARVHAALDETVFAHNDGDNILIVAHGASGHAIMSNLLGRPPEARGDLPVLLNASVTILNVHSRQAAIEATLSAPVSLTTSTI